MKTIFTIISLTFLLASCEDVIDVELDSIKPRIVIEGVINDMVSNVKSNSLKPATISNPESFRRSQVPL